MKKLIFAVAVLSAILLSGCARELIVAEVLQIPEHAVTRTAYNLWYTDPKGMDTINTQQGTILPFGTPVEITKATDRQINFKTSDGKEFSIDFEDDYRLQTPEEYLKDLFTTKTEAQLRSGMDSMTYEKVRRGIVEKGMDKRAVLLAFGPPCAFRTPSMANSTWLYPVDFLLFKRVIFQGDKVLEILHP